MKKKIQATKVFQKNYQTNKRIIVNQGGTGSSKTYSLAQLFVVKALEERGKVFSIVRANMPSLRASAMKDFFSILRKLHLYNEADHIKSHNSYLLNGNEIEFFGLEEAQKVRSRRRDYLWINEANELSLESFRQLNLRTNTRTYMDFNPSDEFHWIYDDVLTRKDCELIISTYKDNPFLPKGSVMEIERFKDLDVNYWNIYGLGQRGASSARIYTHFKLIDELPKNQETIYGLDFGYNHPTSLCKVVLKDGTVFAQELIYESFLLNAQLIRKMNDLKVSKSTYIFADSEDPQRIEEIRQAGFNILKADKDVSKGIEDIKTHHLFITKDSVNALKELKSYSWKMKDEHPTDEPVKANDDFCDSLRYAVHSYLLATSNKIDYALV